MNRPLLRHLLLMVLLGASGSLALASPTAQHTDRDYDGVPDQLDLCADTPQIKKISRSSRVAPLFEPEYLSNEPVSVPVDHNGCPKDSDGDKVADYLDYCPDDLPVEISAGVNRNGCPLQSDGDGTPDYRDACPNTPKGVKTDPTGCPA